MSINSVQLYMKGLLDGMDLPVSMGGNKLTAMVSPPAKDSRTVPRCYIWGSTGTEARRTMPRTEGFKNVEHKIDIWVVAFASPKGVGTGSQDSPFPSILEAIMNQLRTTPMPVINLVDNITGRTSDIISIGEDMKWDYAPVHTIVPDRTLRFDGRIVATVKEWLQA